MVVKMVVIKLFNVMIVIDVGYGGNDFGVLYDESEIFFYYMEKNYIFKLVKLVVKEFWVWGVWVILIWDNDCYVDFKFCLEMVESIYVDVFIFFYFDFLLYVNEGMGVIIYYYYKGNNSKKFVLVINSQFNNLLLCNNGVDFSDFLVFCDNICLVILCEMGYINIDQDFKQIISFIYCIKVVKDIVNGLDKYFKEVN